MNEECPESIDWAFIKYGWNFRRDRLPGIMNKLQRCPDRTKVIIIKTPQEANRTLEELKSMGDAFFTTESIV